MLKLLHLYTGSDFWIASNIPTGTYLCHPRNRFLTHPSNHLSLSHGPLIPLQKYLHIQWQLANAQPPLLLMWRHLMTSPRSLSIGTKPFLLPPKNLRFVFLTFARFASSELAPKIQKKRFLHHSSNLGFRRRPLVIKTWDWKVEGSSSERR